MDKTLEFPKFMQALHDLGHDVEGARVLEAPADQWHAVPADIRRAFLAPLGFATDDPDAVTIRLGRRPNAPRSLDNVLVMLKGPEAPEPEPQVLAPVEEPEEVSLPAGP
ncbi:MAG TPA: hypothetical protein VM889_03315, partial [Candidatus Thermoplasmatota archaeon]|nr:hypothetical protein [Candidatus Thermoplasmatota archaeon]